jgi:ribonucleoside-diphosphate reductase beta chain
VAHHTSFQTVSAGLDRGSLPMRLSQKAKRLGIWDPYDVDLSRDRADWLSLTDNQREVLLQLTSLFQAGEESVTLDLLPLLMVVANEGRLEEELFLTSFLWEEGKHMEFFRRVLDEVCVETGDLERFHGPSYRRLFYEELPASMAALVDDPSPGAQARAVVTYTMIVEGVLAETGYYSYFESLEQNDLLPGLRSGVAKLKQDESRHIAYGIYLLARLLAEHDEWDTIETRMGELLPLAMGVIDESLAGYGELPFGLAPEQFVEYATSQFGKRLARLELARTQTLAEVVADESLDSNA